jgi:myo-inositol 2-dehydrogenase / D-chiro-inositol 1-dehydrogenase
LLNIGIIGTGWFSEVHAKILSTMKEANIKAVCGTKIQKAEVFGRKFGDAKGYGNVEKMLDGEKLDAVYICVPPFAHGEIELQLINRGIPFFVEKPLGTNLEIPRNILDALQRKPVTTSVGYHFRYRNSASLLKEELKSCSLGMVMGYWMGSMPQVSWWRNQSKSGGQLVEQTTHLIDLLRFTVGEVDEVSAVFGQKALQQIHQNVTVPDIGTVTLKMKNGALATMSNTCLLPEGDSKVGMEFYHDYGILQLDQEKLTKSERGAVTEWKDAENPYIRENAAFIHAVKTGDTSGILSDYADAFRTQEVTVAASKSAEIGKGVKLSYL